MAETTYTYSISADTLNHKIDAGKLQEEIENTSTITISLNRIDTTGDDISIVFNDALPGDSNNDEVTILTGLVNAHDGVIVTPPSIVRIQETQDKFKNLFVKGYRFVCDVDKTTDNDISFSYNIELNNGYAEAKDFSDGDYISMYIVHPTYGVIGQFAESVYIPSSGIIRSEHPLDTSALPAGIIIRFSYTAVATSKPDPILYIHLRYFR